MFVKIFTNHKKKDDKMNADKVINKCYFFPEEGSPVRPTSTVDTYIQALTENIKTNQHTKILAATEWKSLEASMDNLIDNIVSNDIIEKRTITFLVQKSKMAAFSAWNDKIFSKYKYPISISIRSGSQTSLQKEHNMLPLKLKVKNYTQKLIDAEKSFHYKYNGSSLNKNQTRELYAFLINCGLNVDYFKNGRYGYHEKVLVKIADLSGNSDDDCEKEIRQINDITEDVIRKNTCEYVAFAFKTPKAYEIISKTRSDRKNCVSKIYYQEEKILYACYRQRKILDLHLIPYTEALQKSEEFLWDQYFNNESKCMIITGRGNHTCANGSRAVIHDNLPRTMEKIFKHKIESLTPISGNGGFYINFKNPASITLSFDVTESAQKLMHFFALGNESKNNRIAIDHAGLPTQHIDQVIFKALQRVDLPFKFQFEILPTTHNLIWMTADDKNISKFGSRGKGTIEFS